MELLIRIGVINLMTLSVLTASFLFTHSLTGCLVRCQKQFLLHFLSNLMKTGWY